MSQVNMSVPKIIFEGNVSTTVFESVCFWHFRQLKRGFWPLRQLYFEKKILNYFLCVVVLILEEKWNIYETHIFPSSLVQTCWLETTSLCLNTGLSEKKISKFSLFLLKYR